MTEEIWRDIKNYEGDYQVSNFGRVKSLKFGKERILSPHCDKHGYWYVGLWKNNKQRQHALHRLVAEAFIPNPKNLPEVDHVDTDKSDNRVENLRWATSAENQQYALETGAQKSGADMYNSKLTDEQVIYIRDNPDKLSRTKLGEKFGVIPTTISRIQLGKSYKNAGGKIRVERGGCKLDAEQRTEVRELYSTGKYSSRKLGKMFGVGKSAILKIVHGR